ncbi:hypothetical protein DFQ04_0434 [Algoriphagus boseongensis]|uniref:Ca3427-like PBP 2 domain-containing protein n=1 Tax=Algoriphagus boseongensis TaxID=1442587 RepID=A0A4R6T8S3_9BACT|nr:ABC transporter substrate-binding protein [Algoriphagus boseongensis]TDQ18629.1 hypothetical protein DFQ04_0434 [Algoriphagus boseongensis]
METFRIIGVPEHFNYPFRILAESQPFKKDGILISWKEESRGSGQMALDLKNGEVDMALLLTESFMKEFDAGSPFKMLGLYVESPLVWGIHVNPNHQADQINEIESRHFLVSRMGSGSHLMALVLADSLGWEKESLTFEIVGNLDGAKKAFQAGNPGIFLWEKYTTSPEVKANHMKRVGEIPSPWPCFVMAISKETIEKFPKFIFQLREYIYSITSNLKTETTLSQTLAKEYQLDPEDVKSWLNQTEWAKSPEISYEDFDRNILKMMGFEIISKKINPKNLLV